MEKIVVHNFIFTWMVLSNILIISCSLSSPQIQNSYSQRLYYNLNFKNMFISKKILRMSNSCGSKGNKRAFAVELGTCDRPLEIPKDLIGDNSKKTSFCYFDKRSPCQSTQRCPIDDRFCGANRDYFDHVYGTPSKEESSNHEVASEGDISSNGKDDSESEPSPPVFDGSPSSEFSSTYKIPKRRSKSAVQKMRMMRLSSMGVLVSNENMGAGLASYSSSWKNRGHNGLNRKSISEHVSGNSKEMNAQMSKRERRLRRKKLFLMSTWLQISCQIRTRDPLGMIWELIYPCFTYQSFTRLCTG